VRIESYWATSERTTKRGDRQPAVGVGNTIAQTRALVLQTADGVCADRRCIHGNSFHGGLTLPVQGIRLLLPLRCIHGNGYHGGLTPPALCIAMRTSAGIKNDFCDAQTHMHKSGGRQPAVVTVTRLQRGTVSLGAMMVVIKSGGCQPAVGVGNTIAQTQARLFCRLPTVYVRIAVAFTVIVTTGGLRPPLLYCDAEVRRHKKRFLRCKNAHAQERRASARRGSSNAPATASVFVRTGRQRRTRTTGLRQPLLVHDIAFHRKIAPFAVHKRTCTRAAGVSPPWLP
jgi:hypothetical protein